MRPPLAAVLGIAVTLALTLVAEGVTAALVAAPDGAPLPVGRTFLSAMLAATFGASVVGGFVAAHATLAQRARVTVAVAVSAGVLGALSAMSAPDGAPPFVQWSLPVLAIVGALAGGGIRASLRSASA